MTSLKRTLLVVVGTISLILGIAGAFLPLLPTTPFLLLTAACYARGSNRFYTWLMTHPILGAYIRNYMEKRGVPRRTKATALGLLWASISFSTIYVAQSLHLKILLLAIAGGVTIHIVKLPVQASAHPQEEESIEVHPTCNE